MIKCYFLPVNNDEMLFLACGFNLIIRFAVIKAGIKNPQFMG
jgi:hypothetical protein